VLPPKFFVSGISIAIASMLSMRMLSPGAPSRSVSLPPRFSPAVFTSRQRSVKTAKGSYCAVQPPSITSSLPVTKLDSSEARYRTP